MVPENYLPRTEGLYEDITDPFFAWILELLTGLLPGAVLNEEWFVPWEPPPKGVRFDGEVEDGYCELRIC